MPKHFHETLACFFFCAVILPADPVLAADAPRSYIASPEVYRVVAENEKTKVILATWKAGQRDNWHSHPATGVYFLTNCESRIYTADGKFTDGHQKEGGAVVQAPIPSQSFENRGSSECRMIIVEQEP